MRFALGCHILCSFRAKEKVGMGFDDVLMFCHEIVSGEVLSCGGKVPASAPELWTMIACTLAVTVGTFREGKGRHVF